MLAVPFSFSQLTSLQELALFECGITYLPTQGLGHLTSLRITDPDEGYWGEDGEPDESRLDIQPGLGKLTQLRNLMLSRVSLLHGLPSNMGAMQELRHLSLFNVHNK
ncbi:hypothetical protein WJX72_012286 [[Myrmecia] bisecta]|uniref:Uncharacterized protein n=1 Tax=[Myrmecia] bisecta TaxID=41462 RepID=A0AAW1PYD0_9CHLO